MQLNAGIRYIGNGLVNSLRAMQLESTIVDIANDNVTGFDKVGYQRKQSVISSFAEYMGADAVSTTADDKVGRIVNTNNPLDFALKNKGYFQIQGPSGVKLTRDGRFKLDKDGNLLTLDDSKVLGTDGMPIKLHIVPDNPRQVAVDSSGALSVFNKKTNELEYVANIGVVDANGFVVMQPDIKQKYIEFSNVSLAEEFLGLVLPVRNFDANRQMFMIESSNLTKAISQLGSVS